MQCVVKRILQLFICNVYVTISLNQQFYNVRVPAIKATHKSRLAGLILHIKLNLLLQVYSLEEAAVNMVIEQHLHYLRVAFLRSHVQCRHVSLVNSVNVAVIGKQQVHYWQVTLLAGGVKRSSACNVFVIDLAL